MATSNVAIANRALQILGESSRIESLTQDSGNARTMNAAFPFVRNSLLRRYKWGFAVTRASVAADADETLWGNLNRYTLPGDFIRLLRDDETGARVDWKIEEGFIVTGDASPLEFKYLALVTDPQRFDACFDEVFAYRLALATCKQVTGSQPSAELKEEATDALATAKQMGAYEEDPVQPLDDDWVLARL